MTTTLELLGYPTDARLLIIHGDDAAFCSAANEAVFEGLLRGSLSSASAIVPAPAFEEAARLHREHPETDIGVHLTLNCEHDWPRWPGVAVRDAAASLYAPDGALWRDEASTWEHATTDDARVELRAQVELALAAGIDVTHIDTHMYTFLEPRFLRVYVDLAVEYRLPLMLVRQDASRPPKSERAAAFAEQSARLEALGWPLLDHVITRTTNEIAPEQKAARFREIIAELRPGVTHFITHPAKRGAELSKIMPEVAEHRAAEHEIFRDGAVREYCESLGVRLIGYRELQDALRA